ncbi:MAG: serine hydrolase, partial [Candidatus Heimdallarchaeota archaeon]|nr:serine hydrolase [Candidatus Heimdallarchaeota archaeon]
PISKHLPLQLNGKENEIKLKHFMSHSSGLPNIHLCVIVEKKLGARVDYNALDFDREIESWEDLFAYINEFSEFITTKPGERFHYSDTAFSLLQYVIEKVSGLSYSQFLRDNIFNPLDMTVATIRSQFENNGNSTRGHLTDKQNGGQGVTATYANYPLSELIDGGGGVMTNNEGLQHFLSMMMNGGMYNGRRLISEQNYRQMISPFVEINRSTHISYGFGWLLREHNGVRFVFHPGNTGASTTLLGFLMNENVGMFVVNNVNFPPIPIYMNMLQMITGFNFSPEVDQLTENHKEFVGKYLSIGGVEKLEIEIINSDLFIRYLSVDVYGSDELYKPLQPVSSDGTGMNAAEEFYFVRSVTRSLAGQEKVKVIIERVNGQVWMTIGINKYKKIN